MKVRITEGWGERLAQVTIFGVLAGFLVWLAFFAPPPSAANERNSPISRSGVLSVREVELPQGGAVQCVVFEYPYYPRPGGISCDWENVQ